jgi:hypothetical protein
MVAAASAQLQQASCQLSLAFEALDIMSRLICAGKMG